MTTDPSGESAASAQPQLDGMPAATTQPVPPGNPFECGLVPCAVVVDTRNMHGQSRKVFGRGLRPDADGIRTALRRYGFEAVEIYAGVATKTMTNSPSPMVTSALEDNKRYAVRLATADAVVLAGHLAERNGEMEEKQVDVLLALKVADLADRIRQLSAPYEHIVVLSEDMDLMPSYEFAAQRGVTVYAAAFDTVHTREDQINWLVLDEESMRTICPPPAAINLGTPMRQLIARMATTPPPVQAPSWKVESWNGSGRIILSNSKGVTGILRENRRVRAGDRIALWATGIEMEPSSKRFPLLRLSRDRPHDNTFDGVELATVLYWVQPTRAKVLMADTNEKVTIKASPGDLLPGQSVAVFRTTTDGRLATYYLGPLESAPDHEDWPSADTTAVVTIAGPGAGPATWTCQIDESDTPLLVPKEHLKHAAVGDRLRVALAGRSGKGLIAQPLTCCLPVVSEQSDKVPSRT